ncbi:uncharacterized protein F4822DRAFT_143741 [Hypoxylon trugodes]|uniref:uncharacterized protein n=1 Tax=Hypoxylon trugodes TaxID=326681 RepID=UPI00219CB7F5|nr:uncharacterized protein F4822DRAFT_143741 [Hypoxylon trugodes]KAI1392865.1 hypothetical protein F4822DRAFT_143741 [Hypoxylon trugodes]
MSNSQVGTVYQQIIKDVIDASRVDFEEGGVDESVLEELQKTPKQEPEPKPKPRVVRTGGFCEGAGRHYLGLLSLCACCKPPCDSRHFLLVGRRRPSSIHVPFTVHVHSIFTFSSLYPPPPFLSLYNLIVLRIEQCFHPTKKGKMKIIELNI